jgi:lysophospholipase L1-like esterase
MPTSRGQVWARRLLASSQALVHLGLRLRRPAPATAAARTMRVPRDEYVENLRAIAWTARSRRATPVLIGPVYRDRTAHPPEGDDIAWHRAALRAAAESDAIAYLEIPELTEGSYPSNAGLFEEHIHPNHQGHKLMAERLIETLASRGLLADLKTQP